MQPTLEDAATIGLRRSLDSSGEAYVTGATGSSNFRWWRRCGHARRIQDCLVLN
jgi:hypothetical protein